MNPKKYFHQKDSIFIEFYVNKISENGKTYNRLWSLFDANQKRIRLFAPIAALLPQLRIFQSIRGGFYQTKLIKFAMQLVFVGKWKPNKERQIWNN